MGGGLRERHGQPYVVVDRTYPATYRHGGMTLVDGAPVRSGCWPALVALEPAVGERPLLFIDLETTGLAGGAGTYAFLVGCAWFEGAAFRVRQFLLARYGAERGLLEELAEVAGRAGALATYNGKTFDVPLIETRFLFHRLATPFAGMPHVDMIHPARRLWSAARFQPGGSALEPPDGGMPAAPGSAACWPPPSCRLTALEASVLGVVRRGDVPGFEIPSRYFQFVRSGDPEPLAAVLEHNRLDLLSLAMLTARAARLLDQGAGAAASAREALGLGRLYERRGMLAEARACYAHVAGAPCAGRGQGGRTQDAFAEETSLEALRRYAILSRRAREHDEAAGAWRRILDLPRCPVQFVQEASEALAVHHEHRARDLRVARQYARESLRAGGSLTRAAALHRRLARLDRKLARPSALF